MSLIEFLKDARKSLVCLLGGWMLALAAASSVAAPAPVDLRLVVETSADMARLDPDNLRGHGLELLIRGVPDGARAGLWSFSRHTTQVAKYETVSGLWRQVASIHAGSLGEGGSRVDLPGALNAATWDEASPARSPAHLVLFASGSIDTGESAERHALARRDLLAQWGAGLAARRITVHTIGFQSPAGGNPPAGDPDLLKQLAELSGGLHRQIGDIADLNAAILDIQKVIASTPEARLDTAGRFQVAPGADRFTVLWFIDEDAAESAALEQPDGKRIGRLTPIDGGRWLRAQQFEIATIESPQPGWWRVVGAVPDRLQVFGEIAVEITGLDSTLVPSEDSSVHITLYDNGQPIRDAAFLNLLDVRAWAKIDGERMPLPVDASESGFEAFFVNLRDGAHQFEVSVVAPTFSRVITKPFVVSNPLRVEIREGSDGGAAAWVHFSHPEVDYATVRTAGLVRKPPQIATLVPGQRMPAGIWQIPLESQDGIIEVAFSIAGNYLNGKGVYLKTKPHALQLPLPPGGNVTLRYDATGKLLSLPEDTAPVIEQGMPHDAPAQGQPATTPAATEGSGEAPQVALDPPRPLIPWWFVGVISLLNLLLAAVVWWVCKPEPLQLAPVA